MDYKFLTEQEPDPSRDACLQAVLYLLPDIHFSYRVFWEQLTSRGYIEGLDQSNPKFTLLYIKAEKAFAMRVAQLKRLNRPLPLGRMLARCYFFNAISDNRIQQKIQAIYEAAFYTSVGTTSAQEAMIQAAIDAQRKSHFPSYLDLLQEMGVFSLPSKCTYSQLLTRIFSKFIGSVLAEAVPPFKQLNHLKDKLFEMQFLVPKDSISFDAAEDKSRCDLTKLIFTRYHTSKIRRDATKSDMYLYPFPPLQPHQLKDVLSDHRKVSHIYIYSVYMITFVIFIMYIPPFLYLLYDCMIV